jgi:hypothetical protein
MIIPTTAHRLLKPTASTIRPGHSWRESWLNADGEKGPQVSADPSGRPVSWPSPAGLTIPLELGRAILSGPGAFCHSQVRPLLRVAVSFAVRAATVIFCVSVSLLDRSVSSPEVWHPPVSHEGFSP